MSQKFQRPKGTQDIFGDEMRQWQHVENTTRTLLNRAGYHEIRTPIFESTELFRRSVGESTDIVNKEMYTFEKSERSLTLRPEGTAGIVRSFIEQGISRWPKPVKLYYMGPMFRYERPQAGRQRQFHQIGLELFGLDTPAADAEAIWMALRLLDTVGVPDLELEINNIGTPEEREVFKAAFRQKTQPFLQELCEDCHTRHHTNPLRMLDCKIEQCKELYSQDELQAFLDRDFTGEASQAHFAELSRTLDSLDVEYRRNPRLVRGLDYYTKTVFEITSRHLGAQNAVCGGGRYNNLVESLGGPPTPAIGWGMGMERLVSLLEPIEAEPPIYYIVTDQPAEAIKLAADLSNHGLRVEVDLSGKGFGKQLAQADKLQARHALILGEVEASSGQYQVKDLQTGEQRLTDRESILLGGTTLGG